MIRLGSFTKIRIYEADPTEALDTPRHEFIEHLLTRDLVAPYKQLINKLISLFEDEMYDSGPGKLKSA